MAQILTLIAIASALILVVLRIRSGHLHLRVADWPLGQQIEAGLALLFSLVAVLALIAGEYGFALWLGLMAALLLAFTALSWRR